MNSIDFELKAPVIDRISECDVADWMRTKLQTLRSETGIPITSMEIVSTDYGKMVEWRKYTSWTIHANSVCAYSHESLAAAVKALRSEMMNNPAEKASQKRREATALLAEASVLDSLVLKQEAK